MILLFLLMGRTSRSGPSRTTQWRRDNAWIRNNLFQNDVEHDGDYLAEHFIDTFAQSNFLASDENEDDNSDEDDYHERCLPSDDEGIQKQI